MEIVTNIIIKIKRNRKDRMIEAEAKNDDAGEALKAFKVDNEGNINKTLIKQNIVSARIARE